MVFGVNVWFCFYRQKVTDQLKPDFSGFNAFSVSDLFALLIGSEYRFS